MPPMKLITRIALALGALAGLWLLERRTRQVAAVLDWLSPDFETHGQPDEPWDGTTDARFDTMSGDRRRATPWDMTIHEPLAALRDSIRFDPTVPEGHVRIDGVLYDRGVDSTVPDAPDMGTLPMLTGCG